VKYEIPPFLFNLVSTNVKDVQSVSYKQIIILLRRAILITWQHFSIAKLWNDSRAGGFLTLDIYKNLIQQQFQKENAAEAFSVSILVERSAGSALG
jgi:hypothetical protein